MLITFCLAILFQFVKPMPPMESETPAQEYDGTKPVSIAMANVYGWLPADKQPKKNIQQTETVNPPSPAPTKMPIDYDLQRVAAKAATNVYGWLPADKQPKKLVDIKAAPPPPPANYDIKRVASEAAESVYSWLAIEQQPKLMDTKMNNLSGQKRKFSDDISDNKHKKSMN
ncbi:hypothetical protein niasHS_013723 [Heterodera schachtii]|uniref:Gland protein n=1 Tax=Heterodera schachtii TaxID=97005 RepID=A0ABD2IK81_HETSC